MHQKLQFPAKSKRAITNPIYKIGDLLDATICRPISVTTSSSKFLGRTLLAQITTYVERKESLHCLILDLRVGSHLRMPFFYWKSSSWDRLWHFVSCTTLDSSKFWLDKTWNLPGKIEVSEFPQLAFECTESFLTKILHQVTVVEVVSVWIALKHDVTKRTVPVPLQFTL